MLVRHSSSSRFEETFVDLGEINNPNEIDWLHNFPSQQENQGNRNFFLELTHINCHWVLRKIMSLIKAMQFASRVRKKFKVGRKPKKQGLRGGMCAKRKAI